MVQDLEQNLKLRVGQDHWGGKPSSNSAPTLNTKLRQWNLKPVEFEACGALKGILVTTNKMGPTPVHIDSTPWWH